MIKSTKHVEGGVCAPEGFLAAGVACGLKRSNKKDVSLIYSISPCTAAGVFTKNCVKAAPVIVSQKNIKGDKIHAMIINSGNANACTGKQGINNAIEMTKQTSDALGIKQDEVLVASTGIIGVPMQMKKVTSGIWAASRMINKKGASSAAEAIMTTDLTKKEIALELQLSKHKKVRIGAMAKGSGMIAPHMATMIGLITTDAKISKNDLQKILSDSVDDTFNMVTVDNDMSTNDCVFVMANAKAGEIKSKNEIEIFATAIRHVCEYLAVEIAKDGEGATKLVNVIVKGAASRDDARKAAKSIAGSSLFKCAVYGADPNFGRIMAAAGYSGAEFDPDKTDVYIEKTLLMKKGAATDFNAGFASSLLKKKEVSITIDLKAGQHQAKAWGCDMTEGYIKINAKYHT